MPLTYRVYRYVQPALQRIVGCRFRQAPTTRFENCSGQMLSIADWFNAMRINKITNGKEVTPDCLTVGYNPAHCELPSLVSALAVMWSDLYFTPLKTPYFYWIILK